MTNPVAGFAPDSARTSSPYRLTKREREEVACQELDALMRRRQVAATSDEIPGTYLVERLGRDGLWHSLDRDFHSISNARAAALTYELDGQATRVVPVTVAEVEPSDTELDAMWLRQRALEAAEAAADLANYRRIRRFAMRTVFGGDAR